MATWEAEEGSRGVPSIIDCSCRLVAEFSFYLAGFSQWKGQNEKEKKKQGNRCDPCLALASWRTVKHGELYGLLEYRVVDHRTVPNTRYRDDPNLQMIYNDDLSKIRGNTKRG